MSLPSSYYDHSNERMKSRKKAPKEQEMKDRINVERERGLGVCTLDAVASVASFDFCTLEAEGSIAVLIGNLETRRGSPAKRAELGRLGRRSLVLYRLLTSCEYTGSYRVHQDSCY